MPALSARLRAGVDWPEPWSGGRLRGRRAVEAHLRDQAQVVRLQVTPVVVRRAGGLVEVTVHQVVRDADGDLLSDTTVQHTLTVVDGLVTRLDVGEPPA